jgi:hypothetical protein
LLSPGLGGGGVAAVGVQRVPAVGELVRAVGTGDGSDLARPRWCRSPGASTPHSCCAGLSSVVLRVGLVRSGQYPEPPPLEPDEELAAGAVPEVVISCHSPTAAFRPLPLFWPGAVSLAKVYSGCPSKAAWVEPSERVIVPNVPDTPTALTGPLSGGQLCAHAPLHLDIVEVSGANE